MLKTLGSWYVGLSVYRASALKTSVVTEQPNVPLAFVVLSKLIISGSDSGSVSQVTEILAEVQSKRSRLTLPVRGGDSGYADVTAGGWWCWYVRGFTPPWYSSPPGCGCKRGTPALQLFLPAQLSSVEASVDCRTCLRSWVSTQAINLCGVCTQRLSHSAESWRVSVHIAAVPVVWVSLQGRRGIRSKYRSAPRRQQAIKVLNLWGKLEGFG